MWLRRSRAGKVRSRLPVCRWIDAGFCASAHTQDVRSGSKGEILAASRCFPLYPRKRTQVRHHYMSEKCRYCCKSLFASLNTNFPGRTRGDQTLIWGTTLSSDELTGDFGNGLEATSI